MKDKIMKGKEVNNRRGNRMKIAQEAQRQDQ